MDIVHLTAFAVGVYQIGLPLYRRYSDHFRHEAIAREYFLKLTDNAEWWKTVCSIHFS